jgi:hypothetical protein
MKTTEIKNKILQGSKLAIRKLVDKKKKGTFLPVGV